MTPTNPTGHRAAITPDVVARVARHPALAFACTCPVCGAAMVHVNGRVTTTPAGVGIATAAVMRCPRHGHYMIEARITRAPIRDPRPSGAAQRARRSTRTDPAA